MTTITALPAPPQTSSPSTFDTLADAWLASLPTFVTETNIVAGEVINNRDISIAQAGTATTQASNAATSASNALISANNSAASASVTKWLNTTSYTQGAIVWSPINFQTYRNKVAGVNATDPSLYPTGWQLLFSVPDPSAQANYSQLQVLSGIATWQPIPFYPLTAMSVL
jgi:hypothetical protein